MLLERAPDGKIRGILGKSQTESERRGTCGSKTHLEGEKSISQAVEKGKRGVGEATNGGPE